MKERNTSLDAIKGFAILLVMIGHVLKKNEINDPYIYRTIEAVQMPVFIMISGYISGFKLPIENIGQWKNIISKRVVSCLIPFFMWLLLKQWDDLVRGFTNALLQLDRSLWFLMTLFILNVILYTAQFMSKNFRKMGKLQGSFGLCIVIGMISGIFVIQCIFRNKFLSPELTLRYIPPFMLGYLASAYKDDIIKILNKKLQRIVFLLSIIVFVSSCIKYTDYSNASFVIQIVEGLLGSYVVFYAFLNSKENAIKSKLAWLGQYTLEIYVIHFHFARILNRGKLDFGLYSINGMIFVVASFVAMSIVTAALIYMVKQVPIMNLLMFGKRSIQSK